MTVLGLKLKQTHPISLSLQAECVYVGPGNVSCVCAEGWTGDGKVCVEINNCELESRGGCSPNADCKHIGPGQVIYSLRCIIKY